MLKDNFHVQLGRKARFTINPVLSIFLFFVFYMTGQIIAIPFRYLSSFLFSESNSFIINSFRFSLFSLIIPSSLITGTFIAFTKWIEKRPIETLGLGENKFFSKYIKGFGIGMAMMVVYFIIALLSGTLHWSELHFQFNSATVWMGILIVLPGWIIQGASEEIITRGWLYQSSSAKYGGLWGLFIASTIFGVLHLLNPNNSPLSLLNLILFGIFAVLYVLHDGGLCGICALHSTWNWAQGNLLGIEVSGNSSIPGGSLVIPGTMYGRNIMTGGGFGAEGSVIMTIILCISIIFLAYKNVK